VGSTSSKRVHFCAPVENDGAIRTAHGYGVETGLYCEGIPDIASRIPDNVTDNDAERALASIRQRHRTLPYADAETVKEGNLAVVDLQKSPGMDESSFLTQGLSAVCRSSLGLCPGGSIHGAHLSGSGAGKGLTARCILETAYGRSPSSIAQTATKDELDKQISAALMEGGPSLLLDNFNNTTLASSVLASALTERPSKVRILGKSRLAVLNALVFIMVTGNGLILSRDIIRRFLRIELDARVENAEVRDFTSNHLLQDLRRDRADVLVEVLTIWRWGRLKKLGRGKPLGSYEQWGEWVRDPLLELGCQDPVKRMTDTKALDPARQEMASAFQEWWKIFKDRPTTAAQVSETPAVLDHPDPAKRSRQYIAAALAMRAACAPAQWPAANGRATATRSPRPICEPSMIGCISPIGCASAAASGRTSTRPSASSARPAASAELGPISSAPAW
jgi:hypothetical protein